MRGGQYALVCWMSMLVLTDLRMTSYIVVNSFCDAFFRKHAI